MRMRHGLGPRQSVLVYRRPATSAGGASGESATLVLFIILPLGPITGCQIAPMDLLRMIRSWRCCAWPAQNRIWILTHIIAMAWLRRFRATRRFDDFGP